MGRLPRAGPAAAKETDDLAEHGRPEERVSADGGAEGRVRLCWGGDGLGS
jgi:hypothetical protein